MSKFYITTTLPYVNSDPHIGFAAEIIKADVVARYKRLLGFDVFFNTGTDEHGLKIHRKAQEAGVDPQEYCDGYAKKFNDLKESLDLSYDNFIRTTDKHHVEAAQEFWKRCEANGDIYKKNYSVKYCVGCELEKTESELVDGKCPLHPNQELELIEEENYFFRWSAYQDKLLKLYTDNPDFVLPAHRLNEIKKFVERGLEDFSISRLKEKMSWGVPVPGDLDHVMYVWFDALVNYISCLGWPQDEKKFKEFWPGLQVAGKDNLRQQSAMWQAMLMSAGLQTSKQVLIFGFITSEGHKMSKSVGNVVNPYDLIEKYGVDATRYFLLSEIKPFEDSDFTFEKFEIKYNADLANGLGNLVSRVFTLAGKEHFLPLDFQVENEEKVGSEIQAKVRLSWDKYEIALDNFAFNDALAATWELIAYCDNYITQTKPWTMIDGSQEDFVKIIYNLLETLRHIAWQIRPFMPQVSEKIIKQLFVDDTNERKELDKNLKEVQKWGGLQPEEIKVEKGGALFPRLENKN